MPMPSGVAAANMPTTAQNWRSLAPDSTTDAPSAYAASPLWAMMAMKMSSCAPGGGRGRGVLIEAGALAD